MPDPDLYKPVCGRPIATVHQQSEQDKSDHGNSTLGISQENHGGKSRGVYLPERFGTERNEIQDLRDSVTRSRLELREHRVGLRQDRAKALELEAQLWRSFQSYWDGNGALDKATLDGLYSKLNIARDEIGPREEYYNELEDDLERMEYKLNEKEARFYRRFANTSHDGLVNLSFTDSSYGSGRAWSYSNASEHTDNSSSPSNRYLSKIGDANIIRERLSELELERSHYLDLERERDSIGCPLYLPNVEFLKTFPDVRAKYLRELCQIKDDLRTLGVEAGLLEPVRTRETSPTASLGVPTKPSSLQDVSHYIEPLPVPMSAKCSSESDVPRDSTTISNPHKRINQWILDSLTKSFLERARHKAILDDPELDNSAWLCLVHRYWGKDHAAHPLHIYSTGKTCFSFSAGSAYPEADTNINSSGTPWSQKLRAQTQRRSI